MNNIPTQADKVRFGRIVKLGCIIGRLFGIHHCKGRITVHHCGTGAGGRKNHKKTIPLCEGHHQGPEGIDGQRLSKRQWQTKYASEDVLLEHTNALLEKGI